MLSDQNSYCWLIALNGHVIWLKVISKSESLACFLTACQIAARAIAAVAVKTVHV